MTLDTCWAAFGALFGSTPACCISIMRFHFPGGAFAHGCFVGILVLRVAAPSALFETSFVLLYLDVM